MSLLRRPPALSRALVVAAAGVWALLPEALPAQSVIRGTVIEDGTRQPIGVVDLRLIDAAGETKVRTITDTLGVFRMEVPDSGTYSLGVRRVGYAPITAENIEVGEGDELQLEVRLHARAVALEAVTVVAKRRMEPMRIVQFRERAELNKKMGVGRIYMRDDIERIRPNSAQEILDGVIWGTRCRPAVLVDGLPSDGRITSLTAEQLEGIEIYRGITQIPPEYYRYGMCGLALVWSRTDPPGMRPFSWKRLGIATALVAVLGLLLN